MLHLLQLLSGAFLMALSAVLRGGHTLQGVKCLGEYQSVIIAAGQGYAFYGVGSGLQKLSGFCNAKCSEKLLGRHPHIILKQRIKITSIDTDIIRHVRDLDGVAVVALDKGHCLFHILVALVQIGRASGRERV